MNTFIKSAKQGQSIATPFINSYFKKDKETNIISTITDNYCHYDFKILNKVQYVETKNRSMKAFNYYFFILEISKVRNVCKTARNEGVEHFDFFYLNTFSNEKALLWNVKELGKYSIQVRRDIITQDDVNKLSKTFNDNVIIRGFMFMNQTNDNSIQVKKEVFLLPRKLATEIIL